MDMRAKLEEKRKQTNTERNFHEATEAARKSSGVRVREGNTNYRTANAHPSNGVRAAYFSI